MNTLLDIDRCNFKMKSSVLYETRRHKRAPMSGNSKHSKNNLKIYVIIFAKKMYVVDVWTILFSFIFS